MIPRRRKPSGPFFAGDGAGAMGCGVGRGLSRSNRNWATSAAEDAVEHDVGDSLFATVVRPV